MTRTGEGRLHRHAVPACVTVAALSVAALPLVTVGIDPLRQPLSDYATQAPGYLLVGLAALAMAVSAVLLGAALERAQLPDVGAVRLLLGVWSGTLVAAAVFPTNVPGTAPDAAALVHRIAATGVLGVPPLVGWLTRLRARACARWVQVVPQLRAWSGATGLLAGLPQMMSTRSCEYGL